MLTVAELVDFVVRLEDDPTRRDVLDRQPYRFFRAAVDDGLATADAIEEFALVVGHGVQQGVLGFRTQHGGAILPAPDAMWTSNAFQSRGGYYATLQGHQMATLYRQRQRQMNEGIEQPRTNGEDSRSRDVFICHASEDKDTVARPLADALVRRGWSVWLDELELTIGDSLSGHIEAALVGSRFGVAILSPASFAKEWPQRELAGLAAREVDAGTKVILPVWHNVDQHYIATRAPILADRLGALTSAGIEDVADKISRALQRAGMSALAGLPPTSVVQSVESDTASARLPIPTSPDEQARLIAERPRWWEYRLFAGVLLQGKRDLEAKWDDHKLSLPRGTRREVDTASAVDFVSRELAWVGKQVGTLDRILDPALQEKAFGPKGEPGDPDRIKALSGRLIAVYESLLDWAAALRAATISAMYEELVEATACFVDAPLETIRDLIDSAVDQIERLPEAAAEAAEEHPVQIEIVGRLALDPAIKKRHADALKKVENRLGAR